MGIVRKHELRRMLEKQIEIFDKSKEILIDAKEFTQNKRGNTYITQNVILEFSRYIYEKTQTIQEDLVEHVKNQPYKIGDLPILRKLKKMNTKLTQKKAFVTGATGQDGAYLIKHLLQNDYIVFAGVRRVANRNYNNLLRLGINLDHVNLVEFDLTDQANINNCIERIKPDELYNLAAQSHVGTSFLQPITTTHINALGVLYILEAIRQFSPTTKMYQASTSEMYGNYIQNNHKDGSQKKIVIDENTPLNPRSPYGVAKVYAHNIVNNYRESYNLFLVSGILFNHESKIRGDEFVTKKITNYFNNNDFSNPLELGNINAKRDWGFAGDYVIGMYKMLQQSKPIDYVLATGQTYSVKQFIEKIAERKKITLVWEGDGLNEIAKHNNKTIIKINKKYFRPAEIDVLLGDPSKAKKELNWKGSSIEAVVNDMIK